MINLDTAKFCLWGYKTPYNTYRHIHEAFFYALQASGKQVCWLETGEDISGIDFSNTLFLSEGLVAKGIPRRDDCFYVVHNIDATNSLSYFDGLPLLRWGFRCMRIPLTPDYIRLGVETYYWPNELGRMEFPWGTNLLPHEVQANKPDRVFNNESMVVNWVGSSWQGAGAAIAEFARACKENGIKFNMYGNGFGRLGLVSFEENTRLIKESRTAPSFAAPEKLAVGYISCRTLKNISYGQYGLTNSDADNRLFDGNIIYNPDPHQLFYDAEARLPKIKLTELYSVMDYVAENHTYLNRIDSILKAARLLLENR